MAETHWIIVDQASGEVLHADFITSDGVHPAECGWAWDATAQECHQTDRSPDPAVDEIDRGSWTWRPSMAVLRGRRWAAAFEYREARINGGCASPLGPADTTAESRIKLAGAVQMAMLAQASGEPFLMDWTMADNTDVPHDAAEMVALGLAVGAHVNACHAAARAIRAEIDAAADIAALDAIDITAGYP